MDNIPKVYDPKKVEEKWYKFWEDKGYFTPKTDKNKDPYTIVIPPPNVTGELHMGHALNNTIQDILIRWKRMQGYSALWLPGTDHAGIATEAKVRESIAEEGKTKYDLGRDKFLEKAWEWKEKYGGTIINQLKRLGCSCDWTRERFTMDEGCSKAVREVFVRLYEKGLIYRDNYIINWCSTCQTTLSDIEVEYTEEKSNLWYIKYYLKDGGDYLTVATTRPETMLGDTCVAVHPDDERYKDWVGKTVILPIIEREIPVVADHFVDPEFGTGAVKVTPAHDPNDFEISLRHDVEQIKVIDEKGFMSQEAGKFKGMDIYECRKAVVDELEDLGVLEKIEDMEHNVGHCYRCDTIVEPMMSKQWFVKMEPLAKPAIKVVEEEEIKFVPERFTKVYINWLENIRDWCISRQLWWGHRIPAWYCDDCGQVLVSKTDPEKCDKCKSENLTQDPDVLDTWFSSALWPFSTLGWPDKTEDLEYFYPTSVLVTGYDIIFFWIARMIFSGLEFMEEIPFEHVFVTGLVRDSLGRKMSKSLGNGIDPVEVITDYGADTLRFTLSTGNTPGNDMRFYWERVEGSRNFANKIWNASRFVLMNLKDYDGGKPEYEDLTLSDRWIISRLNSLIKEVTESLNNFEIGIAAQKLYDFIWTEFCDWYIELTKQRLYGDDIKSKNTAQYVLSSSLEKIMRLLHPFMPFITEEIWQLLPHEGDSIIKSPWPVWNDDLKFPEEESKMDLIMDAIRGIRNIRSEMNVHPSKEAFIIVRTTDNNTEKTLKEGIEYIKGLARVSEMDFIDNTEKSPEKAMTEVISGAEIYIPLEGLLDFDKEIIRLEKEKKNFEKELDRVNKKLSNKGFLEKAPQEIVEKEKDKQKDYQDKLNKVIERLELIN
ncbi:MAG TPA: valine--tRNA ligase [Thermoanaerobacterales bacterium]|nr:valine--tRNA ligase [Thermoanaerobacterales bacterium]